MADKKLWLLRPMDGLGLFRNPWEPWYDKVFGFVIRAETAMEARQLAASVEYCGDEGSLPWLDEKLSTAVELLADGPKGVVIIDLHSA